MRAGRILASAALAWFTVAGLFAPASAAACTLEPARIRYLYDGGNHATMDDLSPGDEVTVVFTLQGCGQETFSFASYHGEAEADLYQSAEGTFTAGQHWLSIRVPDCPHQVVFVRGTAAEPDEVVAAHQGGGQCELAPVIVLPALTPQEPTVANVLYSPAAALALVSGLALWGAIWIVRNAD